MTQLTMTTGAMAPLTQTEDPTNPDLSTQALKRDEAPRERRGDMYQKRLRLGQRGKTFLVIVWITSAGYRIVKL